MAPRVAGLLASLVVLGGCREIEPPPARRPAPPELRRLRVYILPTDQDTTSPRALLPMLRRALARELSAAGLEAVARAREPHDFSVAVHGSRRGDGEILLSLSASREGEELARVGWITGRFELDDLAGHAAIELTNQLVQQESLLALARAPDVPPPDPPVRGALAVDAGPGRPRILVDGEPLAAGARHVARPTGLHRVRVERGRCAVERLAYVNPGTLSHVHLEADPATCRAQARRGASFGLGFGFGGGAAFSALHTDSAVPFFGIRPALLVNFGISPWVDVRTGIGVTLAKPQTGRGAWIGAEIPARFRFATSSYSTFGIGGQLGAAYFSAVGYPIVEGGVWLAPLGFRFGARGAWELDVPELQLLVGFVPADFLLMDARAGLSLSYLFLD